MTTTDVWRSLLSDILNGGAECHQSDRVNEPRDRDTRELIARGTVIPMSQPAVLCPERRVGYRFMVAEAAWILSGDNRLKTIEPYAKHYAQFSDDGMTLNGAYGPPFTEQVSWIIGALRADPSTRQAVMTLWRPRPGHAKDIPCTIALQWLIRDDVLHCIATMRSSDAWLGIVYDWFTFSMMSAYVALGLRMPWPGNAPRHVELGNLYLNAGSQHLYRRDFAAARCCAVSDDTIIQEQAPLDLSEFAAPWDLPAHLWALAKRDGTARHHFMADLAASTPRVAS